MQEILTVFPPANHLTNRINPKAICKALAPASPSLPLQNPGQGKRISPCVVQYPQRLVFVSSPSLPSSKRREGMKSEQTTSSKIDFFSAARGGIVTHTHQKAETKRREMGSGYRRSSIDPYAERMRRRLTRLVGISEASTICGWCHDVGSVSYIGVWMEWTAGSCIRLGTLGVGDIHGTSSLDGRML